MAQSDSAQGGVRGEQVTLARPRQLLYFSDGVEEEMEVDHTAELSAAPEPAPTVEPAVSGHEADEVDFRAVCRACAFQFDPAILRDITPPMRDTLHYCTGIEIDIMSESASRICRTCMSRADDASQFKLQCCQAEKKLRPHVPSPARCPSPVPALSPAGQLASSTPLYVQDEGENFHYRSPISMLSVLNVGLEELLNEDDAAAPISDDHTDVSANFVNALLEDGISGSDVKNDHVEGNRVNVSFSESVLNFLSAGPQGEGRSSKRTEDVLDESFIGAFSILAKSPGCETNNTKTIEQNPRTVNNKTEIRRIKNINNLLLENSTVSPFDEIIKTYFETEIKDTDNNLEGPNEENNKNKSIIITATDYIKSSMQEREITETEIRDKENNLESNNEENNKNKSFAITDYVKSSMPEQEITKEINELGHTRCRYCYKTFKNIKNVYSHLAMKHHNDCALSGRIDYVKLSMPELSTFRTIQEIGFVRCRYCWNMKFKNIRKLYRHLKKTHEDKCEQSIISQMYKSTLFICNYCGKEFKQKQHIKRHLSRKHEKNSQQGWPCSLCERVFKTLSGQRSHMLSHENKVCGTTSPKDGKKFICSICGNKLSSVQNLNVHLGRHNPENVIHCSVCNKGFKVVSDLKHHMKIHDKRHECDLCSKTFSRSDHLTKHRRKHTGERPYKCTECESNFSWIVDLKRHIQRIHRKKAKEYKKRHSGGK